MSQSSDDDDMWGDTSSSFEYQLFQTTVIAEQKAKLSQQPRQTITKQSQERSSINYSNTTLKKENAFHVHRDLQPDSNPLRNQQPYFAPLGDLSNQNQKNNKRAFDSGAHVDEHDTKKQRPDQTGLPKHTKPSTGMVPKTETHPPSAGADAFPSLPTPSNNIITEQDRSRDDDDDYTWMEFDVDLNALLESVEAKCAPPSTQLKTDDDLIQKREDKQKAALDQQHPLKDGDNTLKVDQKQIESSLSKFGGFMTAGSKKTLDANPEARKKALALFSSSLDQQPNDICTKQNVHLDALSPPSPIPQLKPLSGFTTASGKSMAAPTKDALSKAERLFSETNDTPDSPTHHSLKENMGGSVVRSESIEDNLISVRSDCRFPESLQRGTKRNMDDVEEDQAEFKYEDVLSRYGGFKMGNSKDDFIVSAEAKRQAVALFNASESTRALTQCTQSQRIPCSPPTSESMGSSPQKEQPLSPSRVRKNDADLCSPEWLKSPELTPESKPMEKKRKITTIPVSNPRRLAKRAASGSFKHFKSPIINENIELTKAAVYRQAPSGIQRTGPCVFKMEAKGPRVTLRSFGEPKVYTRNQLLTMNIPSAAIDMTAMAAKDHRFYGWGPREARKEMIRAGALEKFVPVAWIENHYRWIVWKIAGMMRSFPHQLRNWWSPKKIVEQLLYRYEREVNLGHRSALKRIIEQDDVPGKLMTLVVADIATRSPGDPNGPTDAKKYELLLSDGWYQIAAVADARLERAISKGRLAIGHKLTICGAQINGSPQPQSSAATPGNIVLSIASNGCHIAPWDAKLGYQRKRVEFRSLNTLHDDGGVVTAIDVIVCRKYPIMYSETLSDGSVIVRTAREEEEARRESLFNLYGDNCNELALPFSEHPQSVMMQQYSKLLEDTGCPLPTTNEERKVSGYFRVRVCDFPTGDNKPTMTATLLQLDANEVLHMDIREGARYRVFFLMPYIPRNKRHPGLNLKSTRKTRWEPVTNQRGAAQLKMSSLYVPRHITPCDKLLQGVSEEVDMAVVILCVTSTEKRRQASGKTIWYQKLLVSDESKALVQVSIRLPGQPLKHPEGQVIAFTNAQFEMHDAKYKVTHMRVSEESEIVTKLLSSAEYLQKAILRLREWTQHNPEDVESLKQHINKDLLHR